MTSIINCFRRLCPTNYGIPSPQVRSPSVVESSNKPCSDEKNSSAQKTEHKNKFITAKEVFDHLSEVFENHRNIKLSLISEGRVCYQTNKMWQRRIIFGDEQAPETRLRSNLKYMKTEIFKAMLRDSIPGETSLDDSHIEKVKDE